MLYLKQLHFLCAQRFTVYRVLPQSLVHFLPPACPVVGVGVGVSQSQPADEEALRGLASGPPADGGDW